MKTWKGVVIVDTGEVINLGLRPRISSSVQSLSCFYVNCCILIGRRLGSRFWLICFEWVKLDRIWSLVITRLIFCSSPAIFWTPSNLSLPQKMRSKFKDEHTFEKRKAEAERIRQKYSDRIPVTLSVLCTWLIIPGHLWKGGEIRHHRYRQEKIPCPVRLDGRSILLRHSKAYQACSRKGNLHLCQWSFASYCSPYEQHLRRTQGRRRLSLHHVFLPLFHWRRLTL